MSVHFSNKDHELDSVPSVSEEQISKLVEAISRSQHNHRDLIDNLDQAVFTLSLDGEVRVANRRLAEILAASFHDLIGHRLSEFLDVPSWSEVESSLPRFLKKGSWRGTISVRLKGEAAARYFECWVQTVLENGEAACVTGWARDVTRERESELLFTEFFQQMREGVFFTTLEGKILDANPALVRLLGYDSKEELLTHNFRDFYHDPLARDILMREIPGIGEPSFPSVPTPMPDREIVLRRKDGKLLQCLGSGFAINDPVGKTVRLQGILFDITERREIESKLQQEQEFVRRLVASFPDLIAVIDRDARFAFVSPRINEYTGISPKDFVGKPLGWRSQPEDRARLLQMFHEVMSGAANAQLEFRSQHADGTWRVLRISASPLFDETGTISGVVTSAHDVTEAKQVEQQLAEKEKFAAMGQMMAGAAHELNNPLTAILGVGELLRERCTDDATRRHLELVLQQARRAASIVQNLVAFARPSAQGRSAVQLEKIVEAALQLQQPVLASKNIAVELDVPGDLPPVDGDTRLLTQVFINLITNAEQAISARGGSGTLTVSIRRLAKNIQVALSDDGPGIPAENIGKIFDPFFTTKRPGGGSGLGLTICLAIVKDHGGTIEVQSTMDRGTVFRVSLPAVSPPRSSFPSPSPARAAESEKATPLHGHAVLIVDDEESIREIVEEGLTGRGMNVRAVESSEAALQYLAVNSCEVVVCDSNLPGLSGDQLFDRLKKQFGASAPRFILMTGDLVDSSSVAKYRERGARLLQKPFHVADLARLLTEVLQEQPAGPV